MSKFFKWPLFWHLKSRLVSIFYLLGSVQQRFAILKMNLECFVTCNVSLSALMNLINKIKCFTGIFILYFRIEFLLVA